MPDDRDAAIRRTEAIGRALYEADALAAVGSDAFMAEVKGTPDPRVSAYVIVPGQRQVVFLGQTEAGVRRFAVIDVPSDAPPTVRLADGEAASADELAMFEARRKVLEEFRPPCPRTYNPIVISDPDRPQWLVYLLASTRDPMEIVIGGHVRATASKATGDIGAPTPLSKSCMALRLDAGPPGSKPVAFAMTALTNPLGSVPSEGYVYTSLLYRMPLVVVGNDNSAWSVEDGRIRPLKTP